MVIALLERFLLVKRMHTLHYEIHLLTTPESNLFLLFQHLH